MPNITYIKEAIKAKTGIELTLQETLNYLLEEKLITQKQAKNAIFRGYNEFYPYFYSQDKNVIDTGPKEYKVRDLVEELLEEPDEED
mgnify:CR=1 FL=1